MILSEKTTKFNSRSVIESQNRSNPWVRGEFEGIKGTWWRPRRDNELRWWVAVDMNDIRWRNTSEIRSLRFSTPHYSATAAAFPEMNRLTRTTVRWSQSKRQQMTPSRAYLFDNTLYVLSAILCYLSIYYTLSLVQVPPKHRDLIEEFMWLKGWREEKRRGRWQWLSFNNNWVEPYSLPLIECW